MTDDAALAFFWGLLIVGFAVTLIVPAAILEAAAGRWPAVGRAIDRIVERIAR